MPGGTSMDKRGTQSLGMTGITASIKSVLCVLDTIVEA